jgi:hypothetical protein
MSPKDLDVENKEVTVISDRKLKANRENAQKSTGPKTSKGKANSRFNAQRHGLTAKLLFDANGNRLNNGLQDLNDDLHDRYGHGDAYTEQLIRNIVLGLWKEHRGTEAELAHFACPDHVSRPDVAFFPGGCLPLIDRYNNANQRAVIRNYALLNKLHPQPPQAPADPDDSREDDLPVLAAEPATEPEGRLPALTLVIPSNQTPAPDLVGAPEPNVTEQIAASPERKNGSETEQPNAWSADGGPASPTVSPDTGVQVDDEQLA